MLLSGLKATTAIRRPAARHPSLSIGVGERPETDDAVRIRGRDEATVRAEIRTGHGEPMTEGGRTFQSEVRQTRTVDVCTHGEQERAVAAEDDAFHRAAGRERLHQAAPGTPDPDVAVVAPACEEPAVRTEGKRVDLAAMTARPVGAMGP